MRAYTVPPLQECSQPCPTLLMLHRLQKPQIDTSTFCSPFPNFQFPFVSRNVSHAWPSDKVPMELSEECLLHTWHTIINFQRGSFSEAMHNKTCNGLENTLYSFCVKRNCNCHVTRIVIARRSNALPENFRTI